MINEGEDVTLCLPYDRGSRSAGSGTKLVNLSNNNASAPLQSPQQRSTPAHQDILQSLELTLENRPTSTSQLSIRRQQKGNNVKGVVRPNMIYLPHSLHSPLRVPSRQRPKSAFCSSPRLTKLFFSFYAVTYELLPGFCLPNVIHACHYKLLALVD